MVQRCLKHSLKIVSFRFYLKYTNKQFRTLCVINTLTEWFYFISNSTFVSTIVLLFIGTFIFDHFTKRLKRKCSKSPRGSLLWKAVYLPWAWFGRVKVKDESQDSPLGCPFRPAQYSFISLCFCWHQLCLP